MKKELGSYKIAKELKIITVLGFSVSQNFFIPRTRVLQLSIVVTE